MSFQALYLPIGATGFDLELAKKKLDESEELLRTIYKHIISPDEMLLSPEMVREFLSDKKPDFVIVQSITISNRAYITEILRQTSCPVLLWTLPEPVTDGARLRLNSLTGAFSAGNTMSALGKRFDYVMGSALDEGVKAKISAVLHASRLKRALTRLNLLQVGNAPDGFSFGVGNDMELMKSFGVRLHSIEARELMETARKYSEEDIRDFIFDTQNMIPELFSIERKNVLDSGRLFKAYFDYCNANNIGAVSSRCWPDFFTCYGTPVCAVLSMLNDLGIPSACEADTCGALSVYIAQYLSNMPAFFGDPVSVSEEGNSLTLWHCGMAPISIAREDTKAQVGVHYNRKIGPTLDFGCRSSEKETIFRVGRRHGGGFRFFISVGMGMDRHKQFEGTTIVVRTMAPVKKLIEDAVSDGWEPHFAVALADISKELKALAKMLDIDVVEY